MPTCPTCRGIGKITQTTICPDCYGNGIITEKMLEFINYYYNKKKIEKEVERLSNEDVFISKHEQTVN